MKRKIKEIWYEPSFFILRMAIIYYIIKFFYYTFNDVEFNAIDELWLTVGYLFIFTVVYVITTFIPLRGADYGPFSIHDNVIKSIENDSDKFGKVLKGHHGLYIENTHFDIKDLPKSYTSYTPISNPELIIAKLDSHILTLEALYVLGDSLREKLITKREHAKYMIAGDYSPSFTEPYFKQSN